MDMKIANPAAAFQSGLGNALALGQQMDSARRQNALADLYQQHGAGIANGEQGALNALAGYDPMMAAQLRRQNEQTAMQSERMNMARASEARAAQSFEMRVAEYARSLEASELAAQREQLRQGIQAASGAQTPEEWDRLAVQFGVPNLVGRFKDREALLAQFMTIDQHLTRMQPPKPLSGPGKVQFDKDNGFLPEDTPLRGQGTSVTVNTGDRPGVDKPPKGFQRTWDEDKRTYVDSPIPGSDVATDRAKVGQKFDLAMSEYERKFDIVDASITKTKEQLGKYGRWVSGWGSLLSGVPESAARDFQATLDTLKANLGFEELQAMRDASPTGGALGQVTEREISFLQAIQGNLDAAQSPQQLMKILEEIQTRRNEFYEERTRILAQDQTLKQAGELERTVRDIPDFSKMSDSELDAYINGLGGGE